MRALVSSLLLAVSVAAQNPPALDPAKVFAYDAVKPLNVKMGKTEEVEAMQVTEISYDSPKIGRVPGYIVVPPGNGPFGGIVYMHWGQANKTEWLAEGVEMAKRGAVSIMIDAPYWRPEVPPASNATAEAERDNHIQMVVDLRRAVDVLVARKDVDPRTTGPPSPNLPRPKQAKARAMPANHCLWFDDDQRRAPVLPKSGKHRPEYPVCGR